MALIQLQNHTPIIFIFNKKLDRALVYFLGKTFKIGFIPFLNKIRYFLMWTIFNKFKRLQIHKFALSLLMDGPKIL